MKCKKKWSYSFILITLITVLSCSSEHDELNLPILPEEETPNDNPIKPEENKECKLLEFSVVDKDIEGVIDEVNKSVKLVFPESIDVSKVYVDVQISDDATIIPSFFELENLNTLDKIKVIAGDGVTEQIYTLDIYKLSGSKEIKDIKVENLDKNDFYLSKNEDTFTISIPFDYPSEKVPLDIIHTGVDISPQKVIVEINKTAPITIIAEDGSSKEYKVKIIKLEEVISDDISGQWKFNTCSFTLYDYDILEDNYKEEYVGFMNGIFINLLKDELNNFSLSADKTNLTYRWSDSENTSEYKMEGDLIDSSLGKGNCYTSEDGLKLYIPFSVDNLNNDELKNNIEMYGSMMAGQASFDTKKHFLYIKLELDKVIN